MGYACPVVRLGERCMLLCVSQKEDEEGEKRNIIIARCGKVREGNSCQNREISSICGTA